MPKRINFGVVIEQGAVRIQGTEREIIRGAVSDNGETRIIPYGFFEHEVFSSRRYAPPERSDIIVEGRLPEENQGKMFMLYDWTKRELYRESRNPFQLMNEIKELENVGVESNIPMVRSMLKRFLNNFECRNIDEIDSSATLGLYWAFRRFDVSRGFKFSTYACNASLKAMGRDNKQATIRGYRERQSGFLEEEPFATQDEIMANKEESRLLTILKNPEISRSLSERERFVIKERFPGALGGNNGKIGKTLEEVGQMLGTTKESARQIQNRGLSKLRTALQSFLD